MDVEVSQPACAAVAEIQPPARNGNTRLAFLDAIRGLASLDVAVSHAVQMKSPLLAYGMLMTMGWAYYAHLSVGLFIVLSGFCLILPVARKGELVGGGATFFRRRAWRILPPFYASLIISIIYTAAAQWLAVRHTTVDLRHIWSNVLLLQDWMPHYNTLNAPYWSVALEWKIYFLFPAMIWLLHRFRRYGSASVLLLCLVISYIVYRGLLFFSPGIVMYHACPWYLVLFGIGVMGGLWVEEPAGALEVRFTRSAFMGVCLISGAAFFALLALYPFRWDGLRMASVYPLMDPIMGLFAVSLLAGIRCGYLRAPLLNWRPLITLGRFSYSLYLTHMLTISVIYTVFRHTPLKHLSTIGFTWIFLAVAIPPALAAAYIFYHFFEKPYAHGRRSKEERIPIRLAD